VVSKNKLNQWLENIEGLKSTYPMYVTHWQYNPDPSELSGIQFPASMAKLVGLTNGTKHCLGGHHARLTVSRIVVT